MAQEPSKAGLIVYEESEDGLAGLWSHFKLNGEPGTETVRGARLDSLAGTWPVEIFYPGGRQAFKGTLTFTALGPSFRLEWASEPAPDGGMTRFEGIGWRLPGGRFASTFQEVQAAPSGG